MEGTETERRNLLLSEYVWLHQALEVLTESLTAPGPWFGTCIHLIGGALTGALCLDEVMQLVVPVQLPH